MMWKYYIRSTADFVGILRSARINYFVKFLLFLKAVFKDFGEVCVLSDDVPVCIASRFSVGLVIGVGLGLTTVAVEASPAPSVLIVLLRCWIG